MHTLGHFDIYGCALAILLLLIPARSVAYVLLAAAFSIVLVLIHHIHLLMYVPTIAVIVLLRYYLVQGVTRQNAIVGFAALAVTGPAFIAAQFYGTMAVPEGEFVRYLQGRMADPSQTSLLGFAFIWYQPLAKEILDTWQRLPSNILGVPVFALLIWLHAPLWRYFSNLIGARRRGPSPHRDRGAGGHHRGYLVMFAIVLDYSRWVSNWAVCMFLILHAVKTLPAAQSAAMTQHKYLRLIITLIPRVGIVRPSSLFDAFFRGRYPLRLKTL